MSLVTTVQFKIRFPEFVAQDDSRIQLFIDDAEIILNENYWGTKYNIGSSYFVAHELARAIKSETSGGNGGGGAVTSRSVDGSSVGYSSKTPDSSSESYYSSTSYGLKYLALSSSLPIAAAIV